MDEEKTNKELVEEKLKEKEKEEDRNSISYIVKRFRFLIIYCVVVLIYYIIRYVVIPNL
ncbi:MAG: hypothetical protein K6A90_08785 [Lachnospiraceae bacterium]|nr:hypothetical protein [Lachnospiraceae bacterium]